MLIEYLSIFISDRILVYIKETFIVENTGITVV